MEDSEVCGTGDASSYFNAPAGLCGNEDCGQMSAWYVFSAMGFYPVNPVSGEYEIGTPLFPEMRMHLDNGKTFTVLAPAVNRENIYIRSVKLNGKPYDKSYTHPSTDKWTGLLWNSR